MIAVWMIYSAWVAALLALAGRAAEEVAAAYGYPRRWVWLATALLGVGLAVVAPRRVVEPEQVASMAVGVPPVADAIVVWEPVAGPSASTIVSGPIAILPTSLAPRSLDAVAPGISWRAAAAERLETIADQLTAWFGVDRIGSLDRGARSMWLGLSVAMILALLFALARSSKDRRRWPHASVLGTRVRVAPREGPVVMGALRPEIVLPQWLLSRPEQEIRLALEHERQHVRAGDRWLLLIGYLATAVLPWNPAMWWIQSRLRLAVELDCDSRVLGAGAPRGVYGSLLLDIASRDVTRGLTGSVAFAGAPSHLERRIRTMTSNSRRRRAGRVWLGGMVTAAALTLAFVTQVPQAAANVRIYAVASDEIAGILSEAPSPVVSPGTAGDVGRAATGSLRRIATLSGRRQTADSQGPAVDTIELFGVVAGTVESLSDRATRVPLIGLVAGSRASATAAQGFPSRIRAAEPANAAVIGRISGTVRDRETGGPIPAVQIYLEGTTYGVLSNASGGFTLDDIPPGTYTVIARRSGYAFGRLNGLVVGSDATAKVDFMLVPAEAVYPTNTQLEIGQIRGVVRDRSTGAPLQNAQIWLDGQPFGSLSSAAGEFTMRMVVPGSYTVFARRTGYAESSLARVEVASGAATPVEFALSPEVIELQGVVTTGSIEPVTGRRSPITVARVNSEAMPVRGLAVTQASRSSESTLELRLRTPANQANGEITGTIRDAETGAAVPTVQVYLQGTSIGGLTNAAGIYRLVGVPAGTYTIVAQRIGYAESRVGQIEIRSGGILNVDFMLARAVLALQEVRARGVGEPYQRRVIVDGVLLDSLGNEIETLRQRPLIVVDGVIVDQPAQRPLIVIDGVIVDQPNDPRNIDELIAPREIDSIEVIKGSAATGAYGSRAQYGVISIKTREAAPAATPAQR